VSEPFQIAGMANLDAAGQRATLCMRDVKSLSELVRKNMTLANEKERSVGALCEALSDGCEKASQPQLPAVQSVLMGFSTVLTRVELQRKALYQRMRPISESFLLQSSRTTSPVVATLRRRDQAIKRAVALPPADRDPHGPQSHQIRLQAVTVNTDAIRDVKLWCNEYNRELKGSLREYAHAQMEFAAKALEQWSNFLEDLTLVDFADDMDQVVTMLEGDGHI
jgi:hypothetical protein